MKSTLERGMCYNNCREGEGIILCIQLKENRKKRPKQRVLCAEQNFKKKHPKKYPIRQINPHFLEKTKPSLHGGVPTRD